MKDICKTDLIQISFYVASVSSRHRWIICKVLLRCRLSECWEYPGVARLVASSRVRFFFLYRRIHTYNLERGVIYSDATVWRPYTTSLPSYTLAHTVVAEMQSRENGCLVLLQRDRVRWRASEIFFFLFPDQSRDDWHARPAIFVGSQGKPIKREQWIVCTNRRAKCVYAACPSRYDPGRICKSVRVKLMSLPREFSSTILV